MEDVLVLNVFLIKNALVHVCEGGGAGNVVHGYYSFRQKLNYLTVCETEYTYIKKVLTAKQYLYVSLIMHCDKTGGHFSVTV